MKFLVGGSNDTVRALALIPGDINQSGIRLCLSLSEALCILDSFE